MSQGGNKQDSAERALDEMWRESMQAIQNIQPGKYSCSGIIF